MSSSNYVAPGQHRHLRACMICSYVQTLQKFRTEGCPNCNGIDNFSYQEYAEEVSSPVFEGLIALREPSKSWVARWQRIGAFVKGMYAVKIDGNIPDDVLGKIEAGGVVYRPRDGSYVAED